MRVYRIKETVYGNGTDWFEAEYKDFLFWHSLDSSLHNTKKQAQAAIDYDRGCRNIQVVYHEDV